MSRSIVRHRCSECGAESTKWAGRCGQCAAWNSLEEVARPSSAPTVIARPLSDVVESDAERLLTGVAELDRVLQGGLVRGSVTLLGGEPGVGKSTLVLQALASLARRRRCLLITGEESAAQVRLRAGRLDALHDEVWLAAETSLPSVLALLQEVQPDVAVIDSIQTMADPEVASSPGSVNQVRDCAAALVSHAKASGTAVILVGQVTKDGSLAGPRLLEHSVDTVLSFEGDRHHALRLLRAVKHRYGATGELGIFEMREQGLCGVPDAGGLFLTDRRAGVAGSAVVPTLDGHRSLVVEVQALVCPAPPGQARRSAQGLDTGRLHLLLAVLEQRAGIRLGGDDVYVSVVGGARLDDTAADLGVALAVASAALDVPLPDDVAAIGEIGLAGEVRQVSRMEERVREARRLGFQRIAVPRGVTLRNGGIVLSSLSEALAALELRSHD